MGIGFTGSLAAIIKENLVRGDDPDHFVKRTLKVPIEPDVRAGRRALLASFCYRFGLTSLASDTPEGSLARFDAPWLSTPPRSAPRTGQR